VVKNWYRKQVYLALGVFLSAFATMEIDATPMEE
jgi:nitroreductase/dihydropteridine reductase